MADPGLAAHTALYGALAAALTPVAVYDAVPPGAAYPYVVIGSQQAIPDDPLASRRDERTFYLSIWSQYHGQKEVLGIIAKIDAAVHHKAFAMTAGRMVRCYVIRKLSQPEPDGATWQGQVAVRMITEH